MSIELLPEKTPTRYHKQWLVKTREVQGITIIADSPLTAHLTPYDAHSRARHDGCA